MLLPGYFSTLIVANRTLLYELYEEDEVTSLLQQLYTETAGLPGSTTPHGVIYYVDRYDTEARDWDNTNVDYTSEATANVAADAIADLIEDWYNDALFEMYVIDIETGTATYLGTMAPRYLLIVGNDDTIPFYRYNDPTDDEGIRDWSTCPQAIGWCIDSTTNPAIHATDEDFFFTDNPYADVSAVPDWETGDIELRVGRILGETAVCAG